MSSHPFPRPRAPLLRRLGFRFVFPIGTMPVPYHPLIPLILLGAPIVWLVLAIPGVASRASGEAHWPMLLMSGALLGVPMSIPLVAWAMMAFRTQLAQALFFLAAMAMVVVDAGYGRTAPGWLVLPALFALVWLGQRFGGMLWVAMLRRRADRFARIALGDRTPVLAPNAIGLANTLVRGGFARRVYVDDGNGQDGRLVEPVSEAQRDAVLALGEGRAPRGWAFEPHSGAILLRRPAPHPRSGHLAIEREPVRHPLLPKPPALKRWLVHDGKERRELVIGKAAIAGPLPFAVLLHWTAILGGRSQWVIGFLPETRAVTTTGEDDPSPLLVAQPGELATPDDNALFAEARAAFANDARAEQERRQQANRRRRDANVTPPRTVRVDAAGIRVSPSPDPDSTPAAFWRAVVAEPDAWTRHAETFRAIVADAARADPEDLRRTLNWLEAAIEQRARRAIPAAGQYLAEMPEGLLASDYGRLERIFNSRILGMAWHITPDFDVTPLPPQVPKFGEEAGYGLIRSVPELYFKLAQLNPAMEEIVSRLADEALRYGVSLPPELAAMAAPPTATG